MELSQLVLQRYGSSVNNSCTSATAPREHTVIPQGNTTEVVASQTLERVITPTFVASKSLEPTRSVCGFVLPLEDEVDKDNKDVDEEVP